MGMAQAEADERRSPFFKRGQADNHMDSEGIAQAEADEAAIYGQDDDPLLTELLNENPPEAVARPIAKPAAPRADSANRQKVAAAQRRQVKRPAQVRNGNPIGDLLRLVRRLFPDWRQLSAFAPPAIMMLAVLPGFNVTEGRNGWLGLSSIWGLALYMHYRPIYRLAPRQQGIFEKLAPQWGINAADRVAREGSAFRLVLAVLAIVLGILGAGGLFFGGYTSIQGVRLALQAFGVALDAQSFPGLWWWILPLSNTFVQVVAKHNDSLLMFWGSSVVLDGSTTAFFAAFGFAGFVAQYALVAPTPLLGAMGAHVGLAIAVLTEQIAIGAIVIGKAAIMGRSYVA